jgi:two-component system, NtrC family, nitrogen regulation response regulator NtrX
MKAASLTDRIGFKRFLLEWLLACGWRQNHPDAARILSLGKLVLIVDDDAVVRLVTSRVLQNKGYEVMTAADCSEAIAAIGERRPDMILLDLNFPADIASGGRICWDGLDLMFWLRRLKNARSARFIIITNNGSQQCLESALAAGVVGFFQKPINHERLVELIDRQLKPGSGEVSRYLNFS